MARRARMVKDPDLAGALRSALEKGEFDLAPAVRVIRALEGYSQQELAERAGIDLKVIKSIESGMGNPSFASLVKIASMAKLRVGFVNASSIDLMDPKARSNEERQNRLEEAKALASGRISRKELHKRNALRVDELSFELPSFA